MPSPTRSNHRRIVGLVLSGLMSALLVVSKQAMSGLSEREKRILALRFYDGRTQIEVAKEIGISQAQVSRLEKGVIEKIKKQL